MRKLMEPLDIVLLSRGGKGASAAGITLPVGTLIILLPHAARIVSGQYNGRHFSYGTAFRKEIIAKSVLAFEEMVRWIVS